MKCSRFNFLTDSLCVPLALTQRCLIFTPGCFCALEAVFVLFLFWFVWIQRSSLFCLLRNVQSLSTCACPQRTILHGSTRCEENSEEYRSHLDRSLRFLGFPGQARTRLQVLGFVTVVLAFFTQAIGLSVPTFTLGARDLSVLLLHLEFTRRPRRLGFWRSSSSRIALSVFARQPSLGTSGAGGVDASVVHFRGAPGVVFRVRFTIVLPLYVMVTLHLLVWMSKGTIVDLGVRRKWTDFQVFERLVFLVRVRGSTLHGRLVVRRSPSQSLRFFSALLRRNPSDALDARPLHEASRAT